MVRAVGLLDTDSHELLDAKLGDYHCGELTLGDGDWLVRMPISSRARQLRPELPSHWQARMIQTHVDGKPRRFITSMLDPAQFEAEPLAQLYRQRWENLARSGAIPQHLQWLMHEAHHFVPPPRRLGRSFARQVKRSTRSKYPTKKRLLALN